MRKFLSLILIIAGWSCSRGKLPEGMKGDVAYPDSAYMHQVYEEVKTPYKYGIILRGEGGAPVDCPSVFRHGDQGRVIALATSKDLKTKSAF